MRADEIGPRAGEALGPCPAPVEMGRCLGVRPHPVVGGRGHATVGASGLAAVDARTARGHPAGEMRCTEVRLVGPPGLAPFLVVLGGDVREKRGVDRRFHGAAAVRRARQPRSRPEWAKLTRAAVPRQVFPARKRRADAPPRTGHTAPDTNVIIGSCMVG